MCGIAGVVGGDPRARASRVDAMLDKLRHRGPDECAAQDGGVARLGCARLSIRGGDQGAQPLRTPKGTLVYNGEIYNTDELVKELDHHGVESDGQSDTAILGALLDIYGIKAVDRINGMYALAWDDGRSVWLARDAAGIKPLYYRADGDTFLFASEIAPLLDDDRAVHGPALSRWLTFHHAYGTETFFRGVQRVPPGGILSLPELRFTRNADPALFFSTPNPALTTERLRKVLVRAGSDLSAPERAGIALSGGVDSSLVAALTKGERIAFHGRVDARGCDESRYARAVAQDLGLPLVEIEITAQACRDAFPDVVRALEEPVAGPGALAQWLVAERAAQDVRILFSGCGGDELFGGYARTAALVRDEPPEGLEAYAPLFARVAGKPPAERAFALLDRRAPGLFQREFLEAHPPPYDAFIEAFGKGGLTPDAAAARLEVTLTLPALLHIEDRLAMAFGMEGRFPLLDKRLLKSAMRLAPEARVGADGRLKPLLKDAAAPHLPETVRARRDKMGFPLPLGEWLRGAWGGFVREVLTDRRTLARGMIDAQGVETALSQPDRYDRGLYAALSLELWHRTFLD
jgi:asparagine synthase (glutamine-hydrolysing)